VEHELIADNGAAMKGKTMLVKLVELGVLPSFSRPRVSDRWTGDTRDWTPITIVRLNPEHGCDPQN